MKNFQHEVQMLEMDQYQIVEPIPINTPKQQKTETPRWGLVRCGGPQCGGGRPQEPSQPTDLHVPKKSTKLLKLI